MHTYFYWFFLFSSCAYKFLRYIPSKDLPELRTKIYALLETENFPISHTTFFLPFPKSFTAGAEYFIKMAPLISSLERLSWRTANFQSFSGIWYLRNCVDRIHTHISSAFPRNFAYIFIIPAASREFHWKEFYNVPYVKRFFASYQKTVLFVKNWVNFFLYNEQTEVD